MVRDRFGTKDHGRYSSIQSCVRTNDLDLVGDGYHLTYFEMIGCFSFGNNDYESACRLWDGVMESLLIPVSLVTYHPSRMDHKSLWEGMGYCVQEDLGCEWTDGGIGGNCCELYVGGLEIGNLVNPMGDSVDVGFGLERIVQIMEGKGRVDETSLFDSGLSPVSRDHVRCLSSMRQNGVRPGSKGRESMCRKLTRRLIGQIGPEHELYDWVSDEERLVKRKMDVLKRVWPKHYDKTERFWWETYGITPDELRMMLP